jgi:hypothetical protein
MTRIEELEAKLAKRRNQPGMAENVKMLEDEIARLKAEEEGTWPIEPKEQP